MAINALGDRYANDAHFRNLVNQLQYVMDCGYTLLEIGEALAMAYVLMQKKPESSMYFRKTDLMSIYTNVLDMEE